MNRFRHVPNCGRTRLRIALATAVGLATGCAAAGSGAGVATDAEWRALRQPRPAPLPGAPRVTVGELHVLGPYPWPSGAAIPARLGLSELVAAGLLARRDVEFVERRRFSAAAETERRREPRRPGQPPAGVSRSADFSATAAWVPVGSSAVVEIRLVRLETGTVEGATRLDLPHDLDPVALARAIVAGTLDVLDDLGRLPPWPDAPGAGVAANGGADTGVATDALLAFLRGLSAEEAWRWEEARRGYQDAMRDAGFHEASTALARAARLRLGGTLAESRP